MRARGVFVVVSATLAVGCSSVSDRQAATAGAAAEARPTGTAGAQVDGAAEGADESTDASGGSARPSPWPPPLPGDVPTTGADDWRPGWKPAPDAEQQYLADLDSARFPIGYADDQAESLIALAYSVCSAYYEGASEPDVYDRLADGEGGLPGPTSFDLADQARAVADAAYDNLCANVRPFGNDEVPTPTTGAAIVIAPPVVITGADDAVIDLKKPVAPTAPVLVTITGNDAGEDFVVRAVDGEAKPLVQTTAPYSGTLILDTGPIRTTQLQITATGPWSIQVADPRSAPPLEAGDNTGTGDQVLRYEQGLLRGVVQIDGGVEGSRFEVLAHTESGIDQLVTATSPYSGQVRINATSALVSVTGSGGWSIFLK